MIIEVAATSKLCPLSTIAPGQVICAPERRHALLLVTDQQRKDMPGSVLLIELANGFGAWCNTSVEFIHLPNAKVIA